MSEAAEWFERGRRSVQRKNKSGCCCLLADDDTVISACDAHIAWLDAAICPTAPTSPAPAKESATQQCKHEVHVEFDENVAGTMTADEVRHRWPRFDGPCPHCGERLIAYASQAHYLYGDW